MTARTRRFQLQRHADVSGVSGIGIVADGVEFPDSTVVLRWRGERGSTVMHEDIEALRQIHGHGGSTEVVWIDMDIAPAARDDDGQTATRPEPTYRTVCTVCDQPWAGHVRRTRSYVEDPETSPHLKRVERPVEITDCVAMLKEANQGPIGPVGPIGPTGAMGPSGRDALAPAKATTVLR